MSISRAADLIFDTYLRLLRLPLGEERNALQPTLCDLLDFIADHSTRRTREEIQNACEEIAGFRGPL